MVKEAYDYSDDLIKILADSGNAEAITIDFRSLDSNAKKIRFSHDLLKKHQLLPSFDVLTVAKNHDESLHARNLGNHFYIRDKNFVQALEYYNKSICFGIKDSEDLGMAYANRSAIYFEAGFYKFCLQNIDLALENNYPERLKHKLEERKLKCMECLNNELDNYAKYEKEAEEKSAKLSYTANEKIPFIIEALEYASTPEFGRHIRAKQPLYPGDVVIIEKSYSMSLLKEATYSQCANCLKTNFLNLLPCENCCVAMFCSTECKNEAHKRFHQYECPIMKGIFDLFTKIMVVTIRTTLLGFTLFEDPKKLIELINSIDLDNESAFDLDYTQITEESHFRAIYALATNESSRQIPDIFQRTNLCAIAWDILSNYTELPKILKNEDMEDQFLNVMFRFAQASAVNYHSLCDMKKTDKEAIMYEGTYSPQQFGSGSFAICSLLNHSCAPNVVRITDGNHNIVVVNRTIKKGEQLFDNYGAHHCLETLRERKYMLNTQYKFDCQCVACCKNYPLYIDLPRKNIKGFTSLLNHVDEIKQYDVKLAGQQYQRCIKFLKDHDNKYPCYEVSSIQEMMLACIQISMHNVPMELYLKPVKH